MGVSGRLPMHIFYSNYDPIGLEVLVKAEHDFYREKWQKRIEREKSHLTSL